MQFLSVRVMFESVAERQDRIKAEDMFRASKQYLHRLCQSLSDSARLLSGLSIGCRCLDEARPNSFRP